MASPPGRSHWTRHINHIAPCKGARKTRNSFAVTILRSLQDAKIFCIFYPEAARLSPLATGYHPFALSGRRLVARKHELLYMSQMFINYLNFESLTYQNKERGKMNHSSFPSEEVNAGTE